MNRTKTLRSIGMLSIFFIITSLQAKQNPIQINQKIDLNTYSLIPLSTTIDPSKIMVIDFWATWCGPCIAAFSELEKIQKDFKKEIQILSISGESQLKIASFLSKKEYQLSFFINPSKSLFEKFDITTLPITAIVTKDKSLIWVGPSKDLRSTLNSYLSGKNIAQISENPSYSKYSNPPTPRSGVSKNSFEYYLHLGNASDPYMVKSQKNKKSAANISYLGATVTELIMDLLQIKSTLGLTNHRKDLDKTIINMVAKSSTNHISYGMAIAFVLNDLKDKFNFQIRQIQTETQVYELKITDSKKLSLYKNSIPGGGHVQTKDGQLTITRLSLDNLTDLFENRLEHIVIENNDMDDKYDLNLNTFNSLDALNFQLKNYGLQLNTIQKRMNHTIIK